MPAQSAKAGSGDHRRFAIWVRWVNGQIGVLDRQLAPQGVDRAAVHTGGFVAAEQVKESVVGVGGVVEGAVNL